MGQVQKQLDWYRISGLLLQFSNSHVDMPRKQKENKMSDVGNNRLGNDLFINDKKLLPLTE